MTAAEQLLERVRAWAMPDGERPSGNTRVRQQGRMRFAGNRPWLPFTAVQDFSARGVDFAWHARVRMAPFVYATVTEAFSGGHGRLSARLFGLLPVAFAGGPETDRAEAMRGLAEMPWRPCAFRPAPGLTWAAANDSRLMATFNNGVTCASVSFEVGPDGEIIGVEAVRPRLIGRTAVDTPWHGHLTAYRRFDGIYVPTQAEAGWDTQDGEFIYWQAHVTDFETY